MKKELLALCAITIFFGYFFFSVKERGPTEDIITDEKNLAVQGDREANKRRSIGFDPGEIMVLFFDTASPQWFQSYQNFSDPKYGLKNVLDLFWAPDFKISDDVITGNPVFVRGYNLPKQWCANVVGDPVLDTFAMKDCSGVFSFLFLPSEDVGENEVRYVRKIVDFLEQGKSAPFWNIWNLDIHYAWEGMSGACWMLGRYIIHWGLLYSTFTLWTAGTFLFLFPLFLVNLKSLRLAFLAVLYIVAAFIWTRGCMGLFGVRESVHTLIGYSPPLLICGPSFFLYAYHGRKKYGGIITTSAFLAILGFATLFTFQVRHIQELALSAIFGIASVYILALFSFARFADTHKKTSPIARSSRYDRSIEYIACACKKTALWIIDCGYARHCACALACFSGIASVIFIAGYVSTETNPQDYISGYSVDKTMDRLAAPEGPGQEQIYALLEHKNNLPITDPIFLRSAITWLNDFERTFFSASSPVRTTATVLKAIEEVACGERLCSEKKETENDTPSGLLGRFPQREGDMTYFILPVISGENRLGKFKKYLWHDSGFRIIIGVAAKTDAELKAVLDDMRKFNKNYPGLTITFFGRNVLFAEIGPYLTWGNITNKLMSNGMVAFFVCILVWVWQWNKIQMIAPIRCGLAATAPFLFSLSVFFLVLSLTGKSLDAVSSSISALAISAAGDFQLYFLRSFVRNCETMTWRSAIEKTFDEEGAIIVKDAIMNAAGFLMLVFAYFAPVRELGIIMSVSMALCLIGTLVIMVPLLSLTVTEYVHTANEYKAAT